MNRIIKRRLAMRHSSAVRNISALLMRSQQVIIALQKSLRKPFWFGLGLVFSFAVIVNAFAQQDFVRAQGSEVGTPALQLHHVTLSVNDVERVSQWYVDVLGFTIRDRLNLTRADGRQLQIVRIERPGLRLNISKFPSSVPPDRNGERQGWRHLAFEVDNVDQNYQRLRARGVQFLGEPFTFDPPGYRVAFFRDLEGNILELYQDL